jgi:hypothetical protein
MWGLRLPAAVVLAAVALAGCGGDDDEPASRTIPFEPPSEEGVDTVIRAYLTALDDGDGERTCRYLDDRGQASLIAFLPSNRASLSCRAAVRQVRRRIVPLRRFTIRQVEVAGRSATAQVESRNPRYSSGVLLSNAGDGWKISYPPGLIGRAGERPPPAVPGVPLGDE